MEEKSWDDLFIPNNEFIVIAFNNFNCSENHFPQKEGEIMYLKAITINPATR